ncbi:MAG TPA: SHOCT domain-containing protein [Solirubrobacterales bacterium]
MLAASLSLQLSADIWGMHDNDVGAGWMIVMMIGMALFWGLIILGVVWIIRSAPWASPHSGHGAPLEILDRRFAAGEIDAEEYRERRSALQGKDD